MIKYVAALAVVGLVLVACSGKPITKVVTVSATPPVATASQGSGTDSQAGAGGASASGAQAVRAAAEPYTRAIESGDPDTMRAGAKYAAPTSPAAAYLQYLASVAEADLDGGNAQSATDISPTTAGDGFEACDDPSDRSTCVVFAGFKVNSDGKIVDLTVNGQDVAPRITVGNGQSVTSAGAKFTLLSAYNSVTGHALIVVIRVNTGSQAVSPNTYTAVYRSPSGKQRQATDAGGPTDVGAKSNTVIYMTFKSVQPGGTVKLDGCVGSSCDGQFSATLKVGAK